MVKIDTVTTEQLKLEQANCPDIMNIKKGNHPVSLTFENVVLNGHEVFCETSSGKPKPVVPEQFRSLILKNHHDIDHPGQRESKRRTTSILIQ